MTDLRPFTTLLDLETGRLDPERKVVERRLSDMRSAFAEAGPGEDDPVIYRVYELPLSAETANVVGSTTVIEPGTVGREYYMTKGHFHSVRDRSELYLGLAGEGMLVLATKEGQHAVEPIRRGTLSFVPGGWGHRTVNVGDEPLVFYATYVGDAGHDYSTIERTGFPVLVVAGPTGPAVIENPRYRS